MATWIIENAKNLAGEVKSYRFQTDVERKTDGTNLLVLPALIDPHVHFRTPGQTWKEDFASGARAALRGGVTSVFDMPNTLPHCVTKKDLDDKKTLVSAILKEARIPLRAHYFFGAEKGHLSEIAKVRSEIVGVKLYMGCSTNHLCVSDEGALKELFSICAHLDLLLAIHAEDQGILDLQKNQYRSMHDVRYHGLLRPKAAAIKAVEKAIEIALDVGTRLYFCHISTREEIELIKSARKEELLVYAEATPHHLFLSERDLEQLGARGQVNPPLRGLDDVRALWEGIEAGDIDVIGSDHAPHTLEEKKASYPDSPSGMPGIETLLPLLLNAYHEKKITLQKIVELTRMNAESIFRLPRNEDLVFVDLNEERTVSDKEQRTKCGWSAFSGKKLKGWPKITTIGGHAFDLS